VPALEGDRVGDYFARPGTVARWWAPESGPLDFHYAAELQILEDHLPVDPGWRVLDVGTGRGRFGAWFAERGCRVHGVDLSPEMLEQARLCARRLGVEQRFELSRGDAHDLAAFEAGAFDVVLCMELFDHLSDLARALREMRARLRPGGRLLFTYVPSGSLYGLLGNAYRRLWRHARASEPMISRTYGHREIRAQLERSGLWLERLWGIGVLCLNAQTRLFAASRLSRALLALARAEARRRPYYESPLLARLGAHALGLARAAER
jgi:ubiquinone/menaquinone biosynthesis C-methylase UbiE